MMLYGGLLLEMLVVRDAVWWLHCWRCLWCVMLYGGFVAGDVSGVLLYSDFMSGSRASALLYGQVLTNYGLRLYSPPLRANGTQKRLEGEINVFSNLTEFSDR